MSDDSLDLICEWHLDGNIVRGDVCDLTQTGFFVATTAPLESGLELELRLVREATRRPIYLRGVVEPSSAPGTLAAHRQHGVRIRLMRFSREYIELISGEAPATETSESDRGGEQRSRTADERGWLSEVLDSQDGVPRPADGGDLESEQWEAYETLWERAGVPLFDTAPVTPEALVIDDGELDDVVRTLAELGIKAERLSPVGNSFIANWTRPEHLLVVSASRALTLRLPLRTERQGFVPIMVADSDARTVHAAARRLGYRYIISRPIHPLAMSMLFRQVVYSDHDGRAVPREVLGFAVRWWCAWGRKQPGSMLDLSPNGCQLLVREAPAPDSRIKIRIPGRVAGVRDFTLAGRIIRSHRLAGGHSLGVAFEAASVRVRGRLQQILVSPGPCRLIEDPQSWAGPSDVRTEPSEGDLPRDRRRKPRAFFHQEVVALDQEHQEVKHILVSSDLSVDGLRVEAHPSLEIAERLELALYEDSELEPLRIAAVVDRNDGRKGWWLSFVDLTPEVQDRLARILERFPPVTRLDRSDPGAEAESGRVVLGQVLLRPGRRREDRLA